MNLFALFRNPSQAHATIARSRRASSAASKTGRAARSMPSDEAETLSSAALEWVRMLPSALRPMGLCGSYPRVANRLALCWDDPALVEFMFNELLVDRRGGRAGFPAPIAAELLRLHAFHERRIPFASSKGWAL